MSGCNSVLISSSPHLRLSILKLVAWIVQLSALGWIQDLCGKCVHCRNTSVWGNSREHNCGKHHKHEHFQTKNEQTVRLIGVILMTTSWCVVLRGTFLSLGAMSAAFWKTKYLIQSAVAPPFRSQLSPSFWIESHWVNLIETTENDRNPQLF